MFNIKLETNNGMLLTGQKRKKKENLTKPAEKQALVLENVAHGAGYWVYLVELFLKKVIICARCKTEIFSGSSVVEPELAGSQCWDVLISNEDDFIFPLEHNWSRHSTRGIGRKRKGLRYELFMLL